MEGTNSVDCLAPATNTCLHRLIKYYEPIENVSGTISIALGLFTIYVILRHSPREMSPYKWFILHVTVWDLLAAVYVSFLFAPVPLFPVFAMTVRGPLGRFVATGGAIKIVAGLIYFYIICSSSISLCFAYRLVMLDYAGVRRQRRLWTYCSLLVLFAIFGVVIISYELGTVQSNNEELLAYLLEIRPHWRDEIGNFIIFGTANSTGGGSVHLLALVCAVGGNFFLCAIFMFLIRRRLLAQRATLSERTFRMHRALTIALATQICLPLLCTMIPLISLNIITRMLTINDVLSPIIFAPLFLYHPLDSLATLYFSEPYRRATIRLLRRMTCGYRLTRNSVDSLSSRVPQATSQHRMRSIHSIV